MRKEKLLQFLLKARTKTYAGAGGQVQPAFKGSKQLEYKESEWLYRDVYYEGPKVFMGLETIYYQNKPVFSMCYYGSFKEITKEELDKILREALIKNWQKTRIWEKVEWVKDEYRYLCQPDFKGSIDEFAGLEKLFKNKKEIYMYYYAGGTLVEI